MGAVGQIYHAKRKRDFERIFKKYDEWIYTENIPLYEKFYGSWWKSEDAETIRADTRIIREIVDDYFDKKMITSGHFLWLRSLERFFTPHLKVDGDEFKGDIDLTKLVIEKDLVTPHLSCDGLYERIYSELVMMLRGEGRTVGKCPECGRVFSMNQSGVPRRFCDHSCRQKAYRRRKKL